MQIEMEIAIILPQYKNTDKLMSTHIRLSV